MTYEAMDLTRAERMLSMSYEPGDVLRFNCKSYPFKTGTTLTVVGQAGRDIVVRNESGREILFSPRDHGQKLTVGTAEQIQIAPGELRRFTQNQKTNGIANGDRGRVLGIEGTKATIRFPIPDVLSISIWRPRIRVFDTVIARLAIARKGDGSKPCLVAHAP